MLTKYKVSTNPSVIHERANSEIKKLVTLVINTENSTVLSMLSYKLEREVREAHSLMHWFLTI